MVWALDPCHDSVAALLTRLRRTGADVLEPAGVQWHVSGPDEADDLPMAAEQRRHLYLILKEALTNAARHSRATAIELSVRLAGDRLVAELLDDGTGCAHETGHDEQGQSVHGIASMERRARELGANLSIGPREKGGTRVRLEVPLPAAPVRRVR